MKRRVERTTSNMRVKVGEVEALVRYPVKSMGGELLEVADLGWHGLDGDRRLAFRRVDDRTGFPWLTASRLPELILFAPQRRGPAVTGNLPTHVRTPEGKELAVFGRELATEVGCRHGLPVEMVHLNRGIFDEASISLITSTTVGEIGRLVAQEPDVRRFRPNILIAASRSLSFEEDEWVGGVLSFGETSEAAAIFITNRDERCSMVNLDPDSARPAAEVLRAIVRVRDNKAGVYGAVTRRGRLTVGQSIFFEPAAAQREHL
jgi:MOSC domain-containing protein